MKYFILVILFLLSFNNLDFAQDTTKQVQYRRGIELQPGYQSYDEKYFGKNLNEVKSSLFPLQGTGVWTELNPKVPRVDYLGIHFINKDTGWACGDLGAIIKTTDGGNSWTTCNTPTTNILLKISSCDGQVVMATGYDGTVLKSTDGGENFFQILSPAGIGNDLWGIQLINDTLGWACGTNNLVMRTTDAGTTWQNVLVGTNNAYWWIDFIDYNYGFIAGSLGKIFKTTDGGNSWQTLQAVPTNVSFYTIDVIDSLHIAAAGSGGVNIYSSDAGQTWTQNNVLLINAVNCIAFVNSDTGYAIGEDFGVAKTTNRGQTWVPSLNFIGDWQLQLLQNTVGYCVGNGLKIFKTDGSYDNWRKIILNDNLKDVFFINEATGFAVSAGAFGQLFKTNDYGINWHSVIGAPGGYDVVFLDSLIGLIADDNSKIYKTTDGGLNWFLTNVPGVIGEVRKLFFINKSTGWAITIWSNQSNAKILKTTDGGENWFVQTQQSASDGFTSIYFIDRLNGWATSRYIWQTTDGGNNWIQKSYLPNDHHDDVFFANKDTGWVAMYSSILPSLYTTTDGGENWSEINAVVGARKFYFFPDPKHWIILGFSRYYFTNDGGNNWTEFTDEVPKGLNSFQSFNNINGYCVGTNGLILRYDDTSYIPVELVSFNASIKNRKISLHWQTATELNNYGFEIQRCQTTDMNGLTKWIYVGFVPGSGTTFEAQDYSFIDHNLFSGRYLYRLKQINFDGSFEFSSTIDIEIPVPNKSSLYQNYPNPFNPETSIDYAIGDDTNVSIKLDDITGREVKELVNEKKQAGYYTIKLKADNLSSGIYFYRISTNSGYSETKKLMLLK